MFNKITRFDIHSSALVGYMSHPETNEEYIGIKIPYNHILNGITFHMTMECLEDLVHHLNDNIGVK